MRRVAASGSGMLGETLVLTSPLTMDHPGQRVTHGSRQDERGPRVLCNLLADGSVTLLIGALNLRIAFAGLTPIAPALVDRLTRCSGEAIRHGAQCLLGLVQQGLGWT